MSTAARNHWLKPSKIDFFQVESNDKKYQAQNIGKQWKVSILEKVFMYEDLGKKYYHDQFVHLCYIKGNIDQARQAIKGFHNENQE